MNILQKTIILISIIASLFSINYAFAQDEACNLMQGPAGKSSVCDGSKTDLKSTAKNVINTLLYIVGVSAVIVIIYSGIVYIISAGDSTKVGKAKNTLKYAVVGLIVAIMSYAIVNFVVTNL